MENPNNLPDKIARKELKQLFYPALFTAIAFTLFNPGNCCQNIGKKIEPIQKTTSTSIPKIIESNCPKTGENNLTTSSPSRSPPVKCDKPTQLEEFLYIHNDSMQKLIKPDMPVIIVPIDENQMQKPLGPIEE